MALTASERTTEIVRPAGIETGGGAVDGTQERAKSEGRPSFEDVLARTEGTLATVDARVDVAAVIAAGRPIDQQREAIDQKQQALERGRRKERPGEGTGVPEPRSGPARGAESPTSNRPEIADATTERDSTGIAPRTLHAAGESGDAPELRGGRSDPFGNAANAHTTVSGRDSDWAGSQIERGSTPVNGAAAAALAVGTRSPVPRTDVTGAGAAVRGVEPSVGSGGAAGGPAGGAGGGIGEGGGRDVLARLVGLGARSQGAMAGGDRPSPFKLEHEAALSAQVSRGLAQVLKAGGGDITLRLRPEHLGEVRAQVRVENGVVGVRIEASSDEARTLLERESAALRSALEARGLEVEHVRIEGPARSAERFGEASSETAREREDRDPANAGGDRPADGDRQEPDHGAQGRAQRNVPREMTPEALIAGDALCAYGAEGRIGSGVSWTSSDGVLRLDATA